MVSVKYTNELTSAATPVPMPKKTRFDLSRSFMNPKIVINCKLISDCSRISPETEIINPYTLFVSFRPATSPYGLFLSHTY